MIFSRNGMGRTSFRAACLLLSGIGMAACGGGGGSKSSAPTGPTGSPAVGLNRNVIDFRKVVVGRSVERSVTVTNTGTARLNNISLVDPGEGFAVQGSCSSLAPNESCDLTVAFAPTEQRPYSGALRITSNAASNGVVDLMGDGHGLNVEISSVAQSCANSSVTVRLIVSDADGNPINYLQSHQFSPTLDGSDVDTFTFEGIKELEPVSVALALDWSRSLRDSRASIVQSSEAFIDLLRDTDTAGVFRFAFAVDGNAQDFLVTDAAGKSTLRDALHQPFDGNEAPTVLWDSVDQILGETVAEPNPKKAIILVTDGFDNESTLSADDLAASAADANVSIFPIGFGTVDDETLRDLALDTAGLYYYTPDTVDLGNIYESIASILINQYELTFSHSGSGGQLNVAVVDDFLNEGEDSRQVSACP